MSHLPILPFIVPLVAAIVLLLGHGRGIVFERTISTIAIAISILLAALLLVTASDGAVRVYRLGDWPAPFGIVLVLDRLAAVMVAVTAALAVPVVLVARQGIDTQSRHFHVFLQLQLAGLYGAFLTGDLFNLFVFFEILLLASYALLAHGRDAPRAKATLGYVVLNLLGSALFLVALALIYGTLGTLNMADSGARLATVAAADAPLVRTAFALLAAVFLLKAALLPLGFWLPQTYAAASLPVAMLFVVMTKVGIYALLRVVTSGLSEAAATADLFEPWLSWLAIGTIGIGAIGMLAARRLNLVAANLVLVSSGTLLLGVAAASVTSIAALLTYLVHTTIVTAALFLIADIIAERRGALRDSIEKGGHLGEIKIIGTAYLLLAVAASGAPPLSGFLAKLMVMQSLTATPHAWASWTALLVAGLVTALVLARAASAYFWEPGRADGATATAAIASRADAPRSLALPLVLLLVTALALVPLAAPLSAYARATAAQLEQRQAYRDAVLGNATIERERRP